MYHSVVEQSRTTNYLPIISSPSISCYKFQYIDFHSAIIMASVEIGMWYLVSLECYLGQLTLKLLGFLFRQSEVRLILFNFVFNSESIQLFLQNMGPFSHFRVLLCNKNVLPPFVYPVVRQARWSSTEMLLFITQYVDDEFSRWQLCNMTLLFCVSCYSLLCFALLCFALCVCVCVCVQ